MTPVEYLALSILAQVYALTNPSPIVQGVGIFFFVAWGVASFRAFRRSHQGE